MKYTRLYTGKDGHSHFEDVVVEDKHEALKSSQENKYELDVFKISNSSELLIGHAQKQTIDWHNPPKERVFVMYLSGAIEMEVSSGDFRRFTAGSCCLIEDFEGRGHVTRITETEGLQYLMVVLDKEGR